MTNNKPHTLSLIDALCIVKTGSRTEQERELLDHAYLVIKQHSEVLHLEYQKQCIDEKLDQLKKVSHDDEYQTAVELLFKEMLEIQQSGKTLTFDENLALLEKYKEIEKQKTIDFAKHCLDKALDLDLRTAYSQVEKYYAQARRK